MHVSCILYLHLYSAIELIIIIIIIIIDSARAPFFCCKAPITSPLNCKNKEDFLQSLPASCSHWDAVCADKHA